MPNQTVPFTTQNHRAQRFLYLEQSTVKVGYSDTPSNAIDPSRLLAGQPAFINSSANTIKTRKILVIPEFNASDWDKAKQQSAGCRIQDLLNAEFSIYLYDDRETLIKINWKFFEPRAYFKKDILTSPNISALCRKLNVPADQISLLNKSEFEQVIEGDDTDWEKFAPFERIFLDRSPISTESFERLLNQHCHKIKSLEIIDCPNLVNMPSTLVEKLISLKNLEELILLESNITADALQAILKNATSLKKLNLSSCKNIGKTTLHDLDLGKLEELDLSNSYITADALQSILKNATSLKKLTLSNSRNITANLHDIDLRKLQELVLANINITADALQAILKNTTNLKKLYLSYCNDTGTANFLHNLDLKKLEELFLADSDITADSLQVMLKNATSLKKLHLFHCNDTGTANFLHNLDLKKLEELFLADINITADALQAILKNATNLKKLYLSYCNDTGTYKLHDLDLKKLEDLHISSCDITADSLQAILKNATSLKKLNLSSCKNIGKTTLHDLDLGKLEELDLSNSYITADALQAILKNATSLKKLHLKSCRNIGNAILHHLDLSKLETLDLADSNITAVSLQAILKHAPIKLQEAFQKAKSFPSTGETCRSTTEKSAIDADTHLDTSTCFTVEREFIGHPKSPEISAVRHCSYNKVDLNPIASNQSNPFILQNSSSNLALNKLPVHRSHNQLYHPFQQKGAGYYFGRFKMVLSNEWQPMPSVSSNETLESYWLSIPDEVDIQKSSHNHFYYIRLKNASAHLSKSVTIETLLRCPTESSLLYNSLPGKVKQLVNNCRGFRTDDLELTDPGMTAEKYLNAIIHQRVGACRHRAVAFKYLMQKECPELPVQLITNNVHAYAEVYYQGTWVRCDLGGYPADIRIKNTVLPEQAAHSDTNTDVAPPEQIYAATFSKNGTPVPPDYFQRARNLVSLTLDNIDTFPCGSFNTLDTLHIKNSKFTAHALNTFLQKTPALKTLSIKHCQMTPEEFCNINLSALKILEHVALSGDFIADKLSLRQVMRTAVTQPKWMIEADHIELDVDTAEDSVDATSVPTESNSESTTNTTAESALPPPHTHRASARASSTTPAQIQFKKPVRKLPDYRYFPKIIKTNLATMINADWKKGLIKSQDTQALRMSLQLHCQQTSKPCFYIHRPDELSCAGYYIARDGLTGSVKKGPGGALYDFLHQHKDGVLIINFDLFSPADIARFNSILNDERTVDGVALSPSLKIIGLMNPDNPDTYQGADFYSRFDSRETIDASLLTQPMDITFSDISDSIETNAPAHRVIELNGGGDWQARLIGAWRLEKQQLTFQPGELVAALKSGITSITLNNPPSDDPDFKRFLTDLSIHQGVYHRGRLEASLPDGFKLHFSQLVSFLDKDKYLTFHSSTDLPCHALNRTTLNTCLGYYQSDEATKGLILMPGLIQQHQGKTLAFYLTESINAQDWLALFECAREYQTTFSISLAPGVTLPDDLTPPDAVPHCQLPQQAHTPLFVCEQPWLLHHPDDAIVIDISELAASELLPSMTGCLNPDNELFEFTKKPGFLNQALAENKTIILKGTWPAALVQALTPLILSRSTDTHCTGKLILMSDQADTFTFMTEQTNKLEVITQPNAIQLTPEYEQRLETVTHALTQSPFVFLAGATGVGKTHFIDTEWQSQHPACHYGTDQLLQWLTDTRQGYKTLFIDEANITSNQWSMFEGLFNQPPGIFYQGTYYPLTLDHKVIFAGNPLSYGGERQQPSFFEHHHCQVTFQPLPKAVIAERLHLDAATAEPILAVYDAILQMNLDNTITPREIIMMARLTQAALQADATLSPIEVAKYFAYTLSHVYVPADFRRRLFDEFFKPAQRPRLPALNLKNIIINRTNQAAIEALWHQLTLREQRQTTISGIPATGGLGGIVIEGEPGVGKSALVCDVLIEKGLKEGCDFIRIPVSLNAQEKEALLLQAFHAGKIAIIDEINSSPMLERLLNALLEGHDLQGKTASKPGFMLIGTQNPITFRGRISTTRPLQHRLQTICLQGDYTEAEKKNIITHLGVPPRIANDMIAEFKHQQQRNPALCFRDLLKAARQWVKHHPADTAPLQIDLAALPQVGEICKIVSIANIEQHYAKLLDYTPMPLHARKDAQLSIRKLAKAHGSVQGEILEFTRWQEIITAMGFDSEAIHIKEDINAFTQAIATNLQAGHLIMLAFAVNKETGHPDPHSTRPEDREHAAVITGYDARTDKITIHHWGKSYAVDLVELYHATQILCQTRTQEHYNKNRAHNQTNKFHTAKYVATDSNGERKSIIPEHNSGFQAKLLVVKRPNKDDLLEKRKTRSQRPQTTSHDSLPRNSAVSSIGLYGHAHAGSVAKGVINKFFPRKYHG